MVVSVPLRAPYPTPLEVFRPIYTQQTFISDSSLALKRQLETLYPVTAGTGSTLNGATGIVGSTVGTGESTVAGAAGTVEVVGANTLGGESLDIF